MVERCLLAAAALQLAVVAGCAPEAPSAAPPLVAAEGAARPADAALVLLGRVEPVGGEVEIAARFSGVLASVAVKEGDRVTRGTILAAVDARREEAQVHEANGRVQLARARLARLLAGAGAEERDAVDARRRSAEAELAFARLELERARKLQATGDATEEAVDRARHRVTSLEEQVLSLKKEHAALVRGPLREEVEVARAEVAAAELELKVAEATLEQAVVRAPSDGTVLELYKHAGDVVALELATPILRFADLDRLRVRVEVPEGEGEQLTSGTEGTFEPIGAREPAGKLAVQALLPAYAPRRLFDPRTTARIDARVRHALCEITSAGAGLCAGQRVTVRFGAR